MKVILSHVNLDFDGLASIIAAKKLYPDAQMVITDKLNGAVKQFLAIYRDNIDMKQDHTINWTEVDHIILVDVASLQRVGSFIDQLQPSVTFTLYDHHPVRDDNVNYIEGKVEEVGATVTMLVEEIQKRNLPITSFEATIFGLGIYTDTTAFTNSNTTSRDLKAAGFLLENGMKLELVNRFSEQMNSTEQSSIFSQLLVNATEHQIDGLNIVISSHHQKKFQGGLSTLTRKLVDTTGADAAITVVEMQKRVYVVGRALSNRINFLPLMKMFGGGGHEKAASATIKKGKLDEILSIVTSKVPELIKPAITAAAIMSSPVKSIPPTMTIEKAADLMYRYGHTGFPVVDDDEKLVGIISRRDIDKATHHGLGHAPVKAYMSSNVVTIDLDTSIEEIQKTMIKHDIGRLPVVSDGIIRGILSRTNVIEILHNEHLQAKLSQASLITKHDVKSKLKHQLSADLYRLLRQIGQGADETDVNAFMIGGIVRDLILERENDDVDVVVEGDGIAFAKYVANRYGGQITIHESFGTSTWLHPNGAKIDITSSRFEYYDHPAALPKVEHSNLRQDLYRRDFTINAMAIQLNEKAFGEIVDFFDGCQDLASKSIKVLHNLSFIEDPTRIIRAVRFETKLDFKMDKQTLELAMNSIHKIKELSKQRISNELHKLFEEEKPLLGMQRLFELDFWSILNDEGIDEAVIISHGKRFDSLIHSYSELVTKNEQMWFLYFILPFYKIQNRNWLHLVTPYALNRKEIKLAEEIACIVEQWSSIDNRKPGSYHQLLKNSSDEAILFFISHPDVEEEESQSLLHYLIQRKDMPQLLNGNDLKLMGISPGPIFSNLLSQLELAYLDKEVTTKEEAISWVKAKVESLSLKSSIL